MGRIIEHPSGLKEESEIAFVSAEFWFNIAPELNSNGVSKDLEHLLTFQQGWKACKDFYNINI